MYKIIKKNVIVDDFRNVVNKYYCQVCNSTFLALEDNVCCGCQKIKDPLVPKKTKKPKPNLYFAFIHEGNGFVYCIAREKSNSAKSNIDRFKLVCGNFPDDNTKYAIQMIACGASDPNLQNWIEQVEHIQHNTGRRLTPEERDKIKEQALILYSQNVSVRKIARLLGVDKKIIQKIIVL